MSKSFRMGYTPPLIRFLLWFKRKRYTIDVESGYRHMMTYKKLFGVTYVIAHTVDIMPPDHINCRCVL